MGPSHGGPITVNRRHPCDQRLRGLRSVDVARRGSRRERTSLLDFGGRDLRGTPIYASRTPRVDGIGVGRRRLVPRRGADRGGREGHRGGGAVRALTRVCRALRRALRAERTGRTDDAGHRAAVDSVDAPVCASRGRIEPTRSPVEQPQRFCALRRAGGAPAKITMGSESGLVRARNTTPQGPKLPFTALLLLVPPAGPTRGCKRRLTATSRFVPLSAAAHLTGSSRYEARTYRK